MASGLPLVSLVALVGACLASEAPVRPQRQPSVVSVGDTTPSTAGIPLEAFVSYSIEFSSFPDFAGNSSHPNDFSNNLLNNLGNLTGTKPYIRVGGNTQDYAYATQQEGRSRAPADHPELVSSTAHCWISRPSASSICRSPQIIPQRSPSARSTSSHTIHGPRPDSSTASTLDKTAQQRGMLS